MKLSDQCLSCLVNQVVKVAHMTRVNDKEKLYARVFEYMSQMDFKQTNPEVIGETFKLLKEYIHNDDPYVQIRNYYNQLLLKQLPLFKQRIEDSKDSFYQALRYAIIGNIIDFNPISHHQLEDIISYFDDDTIPFSICDIEQLKDDIINAKTLLYLGDNCGEICLDKLLIEKIKELNPHVQIYFGVRGVPVVNDSIKEDAYQIGMDEYTKIISNVYQQADVIISKGSGNYESLSDENKNIYFLLMVKCQVISSYIQAPIHTLVCKRNI